MNLVRTSPPVAETRIAIAMIPGEPHFSAIVKASAAITNVMANKNIIDADRFPPHASLHICTIPNDRLSTLFADLDATIPETAPTTSVRPGRLREGSSGYVTLDLVPIDGLLGLHEWALQAAATARGYGAGAGTESAAERYGSNWIRDRFTPHYSIAKVDPGKQREAYEIATEALADLGPAPVRRLDVCDIGPRSQRWDVLHRLSG